MQRLTVRDVKTAEKRDKAYRLYDTDGLYLQVATSGSKLWRLKYRLAGKEKVLAIGKFPEVTLAEARDARDDARRLVRTGIDPVQAKRAEREAAIGGDRFEPIAREWFNSRKANWAKSNSDRILGRLVNDVFPYIGREPVDKLSAKQVLSVVQRVEQRGALDTAHRVMQYIGSVMRYAVATQRAEHDVTASLKGALPPARRGHFAAVTEPAEVAALLRSLDDYQGRGTPTVAAALRLAPLFFVRPGELRRARWADFDFDAQEWRYTAPKTETQLIVPLANQAIDVLEDLKRHTGRTVWVFPSARSDDRCMSDNAVLAAMRTLGIPKEQMTGHGFRAMARTILEERLGFEPAVIELQMAHAVRDPLGRAYNRTQWLERRHEMMQRWGDYLDALRNE